jgi:predicted small integral membrane protein
VIESRVTKLVMVGCLALFALLVTFDNVADSDPNFEFVRHVLSWTDFARKYAALSPVAG